MPLTLVTAPTVEPITVEEVKLHVLQGQDVDDGYLGGIVIPAARDRMELATGRAGMTQTWDLVCDQFPGDGYIEIPKPPLQSVTHLKYKDTAGTLQTWAATNYIVDAPAGPRCRRGRLGLAFSKIWPIIYGQVGDIQVRFICGNLPADGVPPMLKWAMLLDCGTMYAHREDVLSGRGAALVQLPTSAARIYRSFRSHPTQSPGATEWRG